MANGIGAKGRRKHLQLKKVAKASSGRRINAGERKL